MQELRPKIEFETIQLKDGTPWWHKALKKVGIRVGIYRYTIAEDIIEFNHGEHEYFRGPSQIIFKWNALEEAVQGRCHTLGDADYENDAGMLDTYCEEVVDDRAKTAWYVIDKFTMCYSRDYYGEDDSSPEWETVRRATFKDFVDIWYGKNAPIVEQLLAKLGLQMPAWWPEP